MDLVSKADLRNLVFDLFLIEMIDAEDENEEEALVEEFVENIILLESERYTYRTKIPKNLDLIGYLLPNYDDKRFRSTVRMNREEFWKVCEAVKGHPVFSSSRQFPVPVQVLIALHRFGVNGNSASIMQVAKDFGVGDGGTLNKITRRVIVAVLSLEQNYINWPNQMERKVISEEMYQEKLPYCIGFVDGVHIPLHQAPEDDPISYFNRKSFYSFNCMIVCDYQKNVIFYHVGQPGKVHDAKVFSASKLSKEASNYFSSDEYIIGDSAYRLTEQMITPYRNSQIKDNNDIRFNRHVSSKRVKIEHLNGEVKSRFASLKGLRMKVNRKGGHKFACEWITACLILYNMLHLSDPWQAEDSDQEMDESEDMEENNTEEEDGKAKRDILKQFICTH